MGVYGTMTGRSHEHESLLERAAAWHARLRADDAAAPDHAGFAAWLEDPASRTSSQEGSFRLLRRDGAMRHVVIRSVPRLNGDGRVVGIVATVEDVTERR